MRLVDSSPDYQGVRQRVGLPPSPGPPCLRESLWFPRTTEQRASATKRQLQPLPMPSPCSRQHLIHLPTSPSFPQEVVYALLLFLNCYYPQILYLKISCLHPHITTNQNREAVDEGKFVQQLCGCQLPDKSFAFKSPLTLVPLGFTICRTPRSAFQTL